MNDLSSIINKNQSLWENEVNSAQQYTVPWLNLDSDLVNQFASGELSGFNEPCGKIGNPLFIKIRKLIYSDIKGKKVLCLASGGGQQSALFSLLGADVTVADICQGQLDGDIKAANHYGYNVKTVLCSMTDLSVFDEESFDIVYQPISICFVPDVALVYKEVFRVLKKGGLYQVDHLNPSTYPTSFVNNIDGWDGVGYRISSPYIGGALRIDENGNENMTSGRVDGEFRHLFIDMFCKLTEAGFQIKYVWEDERNLIDGLINHNGIDSIIQRYINVLSSKN